MKPVIGEKLPREHGLRFERERDPFPGRPWADDDSLFWKKLIRGAAIVLAGAAAVLGGFLVALLWMMR